jgi:hypothetical protein
MPALIGALDDQYAEVRKGAAETLVSISSALTYDRSIGSLVQLKAVYDALRNNSDSTVRGQALLIKRMIESLESLWWFKYRESIVSDHPYLSATIATYLTLQLAYLFFFRRRRFWLSKVRTFPGRTKEGS